MSFTTKKKLNALTELSKAAYKRDDAKLARGMTDKERLECTKLQLEAVRGHLAKSPDDEAWKYMERWCMRKIELLEQIIVHKVLQ